MTSEYIPYPDELVYGHEAAQILGVPERIIRSWAWRGKVKRYPGDGRPNGHGHGYRTMYALPELRPLAHRYLADPRRAAKAAAV